MSEEKKEKLEARERQNEEIEELGEVMLEEIRSSITFSFYQLSEKWKGMSAFQTAAKLRNMSMFCQNLP